MSNQRPHISPSQITRFLNEPALWIVEKLYNVRGDAGPKAWRGAACEAAADRVLFDDGVTDAEALASATERFDAECQGEVRDDIDKSRAELPLYLNNLLPALRKIKSERGPPIERQARIELELPDINAIVIGYADWVWADGGLDLKTVARMPSFDEASGRIKDKPDHVRQMAIYAKAKGRPFSLLYGTPGKQKEPKWYPVGDDEAAKAMRQVMAAARAMDRVLTRPIAEREHVAAMYPPRDLDNFLWDEKTRAKAREIWGL